MIDATDNKAIENRYKVVVSARVKDPDAKPGCIVDTKKTYTWVNLLVHRDMLKYESAEIYARQYSDAVLTFADKFGFDMVRTCISVLKDAGTYVELEQKDTHIQYRGYSSPRNQVVLEASINALRKAIIPVQ